MNNIARTRERYISDQTTSPGQLFLMTEDKTDITLTGDTFLDSQTLLVSTGHGFTVGSWVLLYENNRYVQSRVSAVVGDIVTIAKPLSYTFTTNATVIRGRIDMSVNGSTTPESFKMCLRQFRVPVDITQIRMEMIHGSAGDDSKFGDLTALANGLYMKKYNAEYRSLGVYSANGNFKMFGADVTYSDKAGGGAFSTCVCMRLGGQENYGVVLRVNPRHGDYIEAVVRDNLSGLTAMYMSVLFHYTEGE